MGNCHVTPSSDPNDKNNGNKKTNKKKHNPFKDGISYHHHGDNKLVVWKEPTGREMELRYELGHELGIGEFEVTYLYVVKETREEFTCKLISKKKLRTAVDIKDMRREVEIVRLLPKHPNIMSLKDTYKDKFTQVDIQEEVEDSGGGGVCPLEGV